MDVLYVRWITNGSSVTAIGHVSFLSLFNRFLRYYVTFHLDYNVLFSQPRVTDVVDDV